MKFNSVNEALAFLGGFISCLSWCENERQVGVAEAAEVVGVSTRRIHALMREGRIPYEVVGNTHLMRMRSLIDFKDKPRRPGRKALGEKQR